MYPYKGPWNAPNRLYGFRLERLILKFAAFIGSWKMLEATLTSDVRELCKKTKATSPGLKPVNPNPDQIQTLNPKTLNPNT